MANKMLIDATHPEETRVVVLRGNRVEEFDFETAHRKQLRGNIYLAKVTRVEPSLQAAFVEYGGNRPGFLRFLEIHPDYFQIPLADRQALLAEQEAEARRRQEDDIESFEIGAKAESDEDEEDETEETAEDGDDTAPVMLAAASIELPGAADDGTPATGEDPAPHGDAKDEDDHEEVFVNHGGTAAEHEEDYSHPAKPEAAEEAIA